MSFEKELQALEDYIDHFEPDKFSSSNDFRKISTPSEVHLERARKIKERINRKKELSEAFKKSLEEVDTSDRGVLISQEEIDELLMQRT